MKNINESFEDKEHKLLLKEKESFRKFYGMDKLNWREYFMMLSTEYAKRIKELRDG